MNILCVHAYHNTLCMSYRPKAPLSRAELVDKWEHDLYDPELQKPREQWEKDRVISLYMALMYYLFPYRTEGIMRSWSKLL